MAEKLMLIGVVILQVITIGAIVEITDDVKAVRKIVTYLKGKESSVDEKFNYIRNNQVELYEVLRDLTDVIESVEVKIPEMQKYLKREIERPEGIKFALFKVNDNLRRSNRLMAALTQKTLAAETAIEKLSKPKIHQKWSGRK